MGSEMCIRDRDNSVSIIPVFPPHSGKGLAQLSIQSMDNPVLSRKVYFEKYIRHRTDISSISSAPPFAPVPRFAGGEVHVPLVGAEGHQDTVAAEEGAVGQGAGGTVAEGVAAQLPPHTGGTPTQLQSSSGSSTEVGFGSVEGEPPPQSPASTGGITTRSHPPPSPAAFHTPRSRLSATSSEGHTVATSITPTPSPSALSLEWNFPEEQGGEGAVHPQLPAQAVALRDDQQDPLTSLVLGLLVMNEITVACMSSPGRKPPIPTTWWP